MRQGFTLIQISILLLVASLVMVSVLPSSRTSVNANNASTAKMNAILSALRGYEAANASLPCPGDASQPIGSNTYGVAAGNPGTGSPGNCTGGSVAANFVDSSNNVAIGMVPVRTLGLSNDYALDSFGRDITYAVDTNATSCFSGSLAGKITVTDNGATNSAVAALVSHGADGHGAWIPLTGSSGTAVRLNAGSSDTDQLINAHLTAGFAAAASSLLASAEGTTTTFVRKPPTATFDDLVVYKNGVWNLGGAPAASAVLLPSVTAPGAATYYSGQTFTFTVTFGAAVAITGTPELALSVPQQSGSNATHYATYTGESGNAATFTYTVQSSDYVPNTSSSASLGSPIVLNGGTISVGGATACLNFTAPSLTGVLLNPVSIYVVDSNNYRVQQFSAGGTYLSQFGTQGTGTGQFETPFGIALDSSGNVWVGDNGNTGHKMQKFNSAGTYLLSYTNGVMYSAEGIAFDQTGNVWVVDTAGARIWEINSSGGLIQYRTSSGSGNGQFTAPRGIVFDTSNNYFVIDQTRTQKFTPVSTYDLQFGTSGSGLGQFTKAEAAAITPANYVWVLDTQATSHILQEFDDNGNSLGMSFGTYGSGNGQFKNPTGVAIDPSGNIWVTDSTNNRVEEFSSCGIYEGQFGSAGSGNGQFNNPIGIAITGTPGGGSACITAVTPPGNNDYTTGQVLTFTVTYNEAVAVTGTPQLVLTIGSNTRYATYASGSGTTTLTFTYTIQSTDTAVGIAVASTISLNGGTITAGGTSANLVFTPPSMGITVNATTFMLVADIGNNRVSKLDLLGNYISQIGGCSSGACSAGSGNGAFTTPTDAAVDGSGNIWVTDGGNCRVQEFNSSGTYLSQFGSCGTGNGQFTTASISSFVFSAFGINIDGSGNIWVADANHCRVEEFNATGTYLSQFGSCGSGSGQFNGPQYIRFDFSGNLYVTDNSNGRVQKFNSSGVWQQTFGPAVPGYGTMAGVTDMFIDACKNLWIDDESGLAKIVELDYQGNYVSSFSTGSSGIHGLGIDASGKLYSLSENSGLVDIFNTSGTLLRTFGSTGTANNQFYLPLGITLMGTAPTALPSTSCPAVILSSAGSSPVGPTNGSYTTGQTLSFTVTYDQAVTVTGTPYINITVGTNTRQASYSSGSGTTTLTFQYTVVAGDFAPGGITMNVPIVLNSGTISSNSIASGLYFQPPTLTSVLVNSAQNVYIADQSDARVRLVTASTGFISTYAGTGAAGFSGDGAAATSAKLNNLFGVAVDSSGNIYIGDENNNRIREVSAATGFISTVAGNGTAAYAGDGAAATSAEIAAPHGVAVDSSGNIYIADTNNSRIRKVTVSTGFISTVAGNGTAGYAGDGAAATSAEISGAKGVAVDSSGNIYIADFSNNRVRKVTAATGFISTVAGNGTAGFSGDGAAATSGKINGPAGVAVDSSGNIYIADSSNQRIRKVTVSTGFISTYAGNGAAGSAGDGAAATSAQLNAPYAVALDGSGNLYIADSGSNKVREVTASTGFISTYAGNGTAGGTGDGGLATSAELHNPVGVAVGR